MKKSSIVSLVFAAVFILCGMGFMIMSLRAGNYRFYSDGFMMQVNYSSALSAMSTRYMIFGASLFDGGILLLLLSVLLNRLPKKAYGPAYTTATLRQAGSEKKKRPAAVKADTVADAAPAEEKAGRKSSETEERSSGEEV